MWAQTGRRRRRPTDCLAAKQSWRDTLRLTSVVALPFALPLDDARPFTTHDAQLPSRSPCQHMETLHISPSSPTQPCLLPLHYTPSPTHQTTTMPPVRQNVGNEHLWCSESLININARRQQPLTARQDGWWRAQDGTSARRAEHITVDTDLKQTQPREEQMATPARENQAGQASFASFANTRMTYVGSTLFARRADGLGGQFTTRGSVDNSFPMAAMATPRTFLEVKTVVGSATRGTYNGGGAGNDYTCTRGPGLAKAKGYYDAMGGRFCSPAYNDGGAGNDYTCTRGPRPTNRRTAAVLGVKVIRIPLAKEHHNVMGGRFCKAKRVRQRWRQQPLHLHEKARWTAAVFEVKTILESGSQMALRRDGRSFLQSAHCKAFQTPEDHACKAQATMVAAAARARGPGCYGCDRSQELYISGTGPNLHNEDDDEMGSTAVTPPDDGDESGMQTSVKLEIRL
ncbi:hypothetical protein D9611_010930 [Ephemerocybe angulata]|uniref:Uncharacterized protein n=1 Tax=Ephemerocybe angulata TaxID=980116 RepID=A0A8H5FG48_9AGAR|nr:hypothetical protein D9611_010930 [Tulosesus angulatus]